MSSQRPKSLIPTVKLGAPEVRARRVQRSLSLLSLGPSSSLARARRWTRELFVAPQRRLAIGPSSASDSNLDRDKDRPANGCKIGRKSSSKWAAGKELQQEQDNITVARKLKNRHENMEDNQAVRAFWHLR